MSQKYGRGRQRRTHFTHNDRHRQGASLHSTTFDDDDAILFSSSSNLAKPSRIRRDRLFFSSARSLPAHHPFSACFSVCVCRRGGLGGRSTLPGCGLSLDFLCRGGGFDWRAWRRSTSRRHARLEEAWVRPNPTCPTTKWRMSVRRCSSRGRRSWMACWIGMTTWYVSCALSV